MADTFEDKMEARFDELDDLAAKYAESYAQKEHLEEFNK